MANDGFPPVKTGAMNRFAKEKVKPKNAKGTLKRLYRETKGLKGGLLFIILLSLLISLSSTFSPLLIGQVVNTVNEGGNASKYIIILLLLYIGDWFARFMQQFFTAPIGQKIVNRLRIRLFDSLSEKSLAFFDRNSSGDLISRMTNDIDLVSTTFSESFAKLAVLSVTFVGVIVMMFTLSPLMALLVVFASPFVFLLIRLIAKRTRSLFRAQQKTLGSLSGQLEESVSGFAAVKAFGREEAMIADFEKNNARLCDVGVKAITWTGFLMPTINVIQNLDFVIIVIVGSLLSSRGVITVGLISTFVLYARQFMRPLNEFASLFNTLQSALSGAERVFEVMDGEGENRDTGETLDSSSIRGAISFEDVSFSYVQGKPVIRHFSIDIPQGIKVALVGETGCGKTTLVSLLTRMYELDEGRITLDGRDMRDYSLASLRSAFAVVLQDSRLFSKSVYENLCYGLKEIDRNKCEEVCRSIGADAFIRRLPSGYETKLEEGGMLSEGERQLLTIARAIIVSAPLIILDEATSNVDTRTERNIKSAIDEMTRGRTSFFIAHRLSTIRDSDLIIRMENGAIAEAGSHEELMAQNGGYAAMYKLQAGLQNS